MKDKKEPPVLVIVGSLIFGGGFFYGMGADGCESGIWGVSCPTAEEVHQTFFYGGCIMAAGVTLIIIGGILSWIKHIKGNEKQT